MRVTLRLGGVSSVVRTLAGRDTSLDPSWDLDVPYLRTPWSAAPYLEHHPFELMTERVLVDSGLSDADLTAVRHAIALACRCALAGVDDELLALARSFGSRSRSLVLRRLLKDQQGRVRQMAQVCPALLVLAVEHAHVHPEWLDGIVEARPLPPQLDAVGASLWPDLEPPSVRTWLGHAPAGIDTAGLLTPPMWRVVRSDVPSNPEERRVWYDTMAEVGCVVRKGPAATPEQQRSFCDYVSKYACCAALQRRLGENWLEPAYACHRLVGKRLCRSRALDGWMHEIDELVPATEGLPAALMSSLEPPFPAPRGRTLRGEALRSVGQMCREGRAMRNCLGSLAAQALTGDSCFFALRYREERLNLMLRRVEDQWMVAGLLGEQNAAPSESAARVVKSWLRRRGVVV